MYTPGSRYVRRVRTPAVRNAASRMKAQTRVAPQKRAAAPVNVGTSFAKAGTSGFKMTQLTPTKTMIIGRSFIMGIDTTTYKLQAQTGSNTTPTSGNAIVGVYDVTPTLLGDRVSQIAATFEKYVYKRLTFRYVPQCSTGTAGSVALCFDRDPNNICANPKSSSFLAQVMSYENAALTPAWQHTDVTYYREKGEKKLYYIGGQEANLDCRDTSQGNLVVYASNVASNTQLGFVVCDYVLELSIPNILPKLNGAASITANANSPGQYTFVTDLTNNGAGFDKIYTKISGSTGTAVGGGANGYELTHSFFTTVSNAMAPGTIGEIVVAGTGSSSATNGDQTGVEYRLCTATASSGATAYCGIRPGDKVYFTVTTRLNGQTNYKVMNFFVTLPEAASYARGGMTNLYLTTSNDVMVNHQAGMLYQPTSDAVKCCLNGWLRILSAGDYAVSSA